MLGIYKHFWLVCWAEQWQYRANSLMYLAYWVVSPVTYLAVWTAIANGQGTVNGMTAGDFAAYYLTLLPVGILTSSITIHILAWKIQEGTISNELLQPVHPVLTNTLVNNVAFKALQMIAFTPMWFLLVALFHPALTYTWESLLLGIPAIIMSFLIWFLMDGTITIIAFWTTRVWAVYNLEQAVAGMLNGSFVPLTLLPLGVQAVAQFLPFQLGLSFPVLLILNRLPAEKIALNFGLQGVWAVALYVLFTFVWRKAIKQYAAVGA